MWRDPRESRRRARDLFPGVDAHLVPDVAFARRPPRVPVSPGDRIVWIGVTTARAARCGGRVDRRPGHRLATRPRAEVARELLVADGTGGAPRAVGGRAAAAAGALQPVRADDRPRRPRDLSPPRALSSPTDSTRTSCARCSQSRMCCSTTATARSAPSSTRGRSPTGGRSWRRRRRMPPNALAPAGRDLRRPQMTRPPLGEMHWPVTNELSSLAK